MLTVLVAKLRNDYELNKIRRELHNQKRFDLCKTFRTPTSPVHLRTAHQNSDKDSPSNLDSGRVPSDPVPSPVTPDSDRTPLPEWTWAGQSCRIDCSPSSGGCSWRVRSEMFVRLVSPFHLADDDVRQCSPIDVPPPSPIASCPCRDLSRSSFYCPSCSCHQDSSCCRATTSDGDGGDHPSRWRCSPTWRMRRTLMIDAIDFPRQHSIPSQRHQRGCHSFQAGQENPHSTFETPFAQTSAVSPSQL